MFVPSPRHRSQPGAQPVTQPAATTPALGAPFSPAIAAQTATPTPPQKLATPGVPPTSPHSVRRQNPGDEITAAKGSI